MSLSQEDAVFHVVINSERQYSIWPEGKVVPAGWGTVGVMGDKASCLDHIEKTWTDMRPYSLQQSMQKPGDEA
jgi:MbtH protein